MLVLTFKLGQCVHVGDDVVVYLHSITGNRVQLAFDAPKDVRLLRGELYAQLQQQVESCTSQESQ